MEHTILSARGQADRPGVPAVLPAAAALRPAGGGHPGHCRGRGPGGCAHLLRRGGGEATTTVMPQVDDSGVIDIRRAPPGGGEDAEGRPVCPQRHPHGWTAGRTCGHHHRPPTWRASPPICARWPSSSSWPRWAPSSPARSAHIGVVDRVFTRIGASDDLSAGQSTFMVEMNEVAGAAEKRHRRSLLILDEIGRGTSTYDGMAIARAVLEHCADRKPPGGQDPVRHPLPRAHRPGGPDPRGEKLQHRRQKKRGMTSSSCARSSGAGAGSQHPDPHRGHESAL